MTKNVGNLDRGLRIVVGLALLTFAIAGPADIAWKWVGYIGIVPIVTALISWCPAYTLLGIRTCSAAESKA